MLFQYGDRGDTLGQQLAREIALRIDNTDLRANAVEADILKLCGEAAMYGFRGICVPLRWAGVVNSYRCFARPLWSARMKLSVAIDFPLGVSGTHVRALMAEEAESYGACELDVVMALGDFLDSPEGRLRAREDLRLLAGIRQVKAIIETGYLDDEQIRAAALMAEEAGAFCVKTSTGLEPRVDIARKLVHVEIMRNALQPQTVIKVAGGISKLWQITAFEKVGGANTIFGISMQNAVAIILEAMGLPE